MKIMGIKLVTGQDVFGIFEINRKGQVELTKPVTLRMMPSQIQGGQPSMAMIPFPEMADHDAGPLVVEPLHIVYTFTPFDELVEEYKHIVAGETTSSKQIITG